MEKSKIPLTLLVRSLFRFAYHNKFSRTLITIGIVSVPILSTVFNLVGHTEELPDTWIQPLEAIIRYRKNDPDRPINLPPKGGDNGFYKQKGQGILTAIQGKAYAKLQLWQNKKLLSPFVMVGLDKQQTTDYYFPCPALRRGTITVGWSIRKASSNGCNTKVIAYLPGYGRNKSIATHSIKQQDQQRELVKGKNKQLADNDSDQQIEISPTQDVTLVLIQSRPNELTIDVLLGEIKINPGFGQITLGKRYTYSRSQGSSITQSPENISNLPSVQNFLEPDGWSQEVQEILSDFRLSAQAPLSKTVKELLAAHNECRRRVRIPPLKWSVSLASYAQKWADYLSKTGDFEHRSGGGSGFGENLAAGSMTPTALVNMWCDEQSKYNSQTGQCVNGGMECYHFTQVVWSRTTELGCGIASHPKWGKVLVCNYNPPGNYSGERPY